ncbi:MAG TPA: hypothetical protein ENJ27_02240 [Candidatus Moranbacteria bacterium]|nr:hypothetical protein [Candidatus Moranbacteria bacterium]
MDKILKIKIKMKRKIVKYTELSLVVIFAFLLWQSANKIIQTSQTESWWQPIIFFALFFISWSLGAILVKSKGLFLGTYMLALFSVLFFTTNIFLLGIIILSSSILWIGRSVVRDELDSRIKISVWNSLRLGRRFFVFAIALILTGQYYFGVSQLDKNRTLPEFKISSRQSQWITKALSQFDPAFKSSNNKAMTVDDFILNKMANDKNYINSINLENNFDKKLIPKIGFEKDTKQAIIEKGRESISKMVERTVSGDEKIMDIFSEIINNKINNFANVNIGYVDQNIPIMHWVFTGLLFLSIISIGMFLSPFLIILTWILFETMVRLKFIAVDKKMIEVEIIK